MEIPTTYASPSRAPSISSPSQQPQILHQPSATTTSNLNIPPQQQINTYFQQYNSPPIPNTLNFTPRVFNQYPPIIAPSAEYIDELARGFSRMNIIPQTGFLQPQVDQVNYGKLRADLLERGYVPTYHAKYVTASEYSCGVSETRINKGYCNPTRHLSGSKPIKRMSEAQIDHKMEEMRIKNAEILRKKEEAERDKIEYEQKQVELQIQREMKLKVKEREERIKRELEEKKLELIRKEREMNKKKKGESVAARAWDQEKVNNDIGAEIAVDWHVNTKTNEKTEKRSYRTKRRGKGNSDDES